MKIISKMHDYYDSARAFGEDPSRIFIREEKEIEENTERFYNSIRAYRDMDFGDFYIKKNYIAFCGNLYPLVIIDVIGNSNIKILYSINGFDKYPKIKKRLTKSDYHEWMSGFKTNYAGIQNFFDSYKKINMEEFFKYNVPYFVIEADKIILSPNLKSYNFQQVFDPYSAYQRIDEFVGGVLSSCETPQKIEDKYLIKQKGFNEKSFRRERHQRKKK